MEERKVGRFLFTPFSILRYERLGTSWLHKKLLELPIQQQRLGPRWTYKFFLGSRLFEAEKDSGSESIPQQSALSRRHPFLHSRG